MSAERATSAASLRPACALAATSSPLESAPPAFPLSAATADRFSADSTHADSRLGRRLFFNGVSRVGDFGGSVQSPPFPGRRPFSFVDGRVAGFGGFDRARLSPLAFPCFGRRWLRPPAASVAGLGGSARRLHLDLVAGRADDFGGLYPARIRLRRLPLALVLAGSATSALSIAPIFPLDAAP